jgi:hypothetical protein
MIAHALTDGYT